jgi:NADH-quinone oxidoreductase subunit J
MMQYVAYALGFLTFIMALLVVFTKHPIKSALYLVITFFLISAQYVLMNAQFVAIVNIIVYAGAVMVLILFVLKLLHLNEDTEPQKSVGVKFAAVISAGILFLVLVAALSESAIITQTPTPGMTQQGLIENLGMLLFKKYVVPFEVSSILFLAAMVGAVMIGKREKQISSQS